MKLYMWQLCAAAAMMLVVVVLLTSLRTGGRLRRTITKLREARKRRVFATVCLVLLAVIGVYDYREQLWSSSLPANAAARRDALVRIKESVGVQLFREAGCTGESMVVSTLGRERHCSSCTDLCGKQWPRDRKGVLGQVKSVRVVGQPEHPSWSLSLNTNCVGKYSYKNPAKTSFQNGIKVEDGCVDMTKNLGECTPTMQLTERRAPRS